MDITTLTIYVNDNEMVAANVSRDQSPALFEAFQAWQDAEQASHDEAGKWDRVLAEKVYLPNNPNKLRTAHPDVKSAVVDFKERIARTRF